MATVVVLFFLNLLDLLWIIRLHKSFNASAFKHGWNSNLLLGSDRFTGLILALRMKFAW